MSTETTGPAQRGLFSRLLRFDREGLVVLTLIAFVLSALVFYYHEQSRELALRERAADQQRESIEYARAQDAIRRHAAEVRALSELSIDISVVNDEARELDISLRKLPPGAGTDQAVAQLTKLRASIKAAMDSSIANTVAISPTSYNIFDRNVAERPHLIMISDISAAATPEDVTSNMKTIVLSVVYTALFLVFAICSIGLFKTTNDEVRKFCFDTLKTLLGFFTGAGASLFVK